MVDRLTKVAHFMPVKTTYTGARLAELYISRIVCLHGVPKKIVLDRGLSVHISNLAEVACVDGHEVEFQPKMMLNWAVLTMGIRAEVP
jgi:hypothetical protein